MQKQPILRSHAARVCHVAPAALICLNGESRQTEGRGVAEETEGQDAETRTTGAAAEYAGIALAVGGASREEADAFLRNQRVLTVKQTRLTDLQIEELSREDRLRHWSLRVRHINDVMKLAFAISVAFISLVAAIGLGTLVWQAQNAHGLVVQPFRVPADMAARGSDGTVLAQHLLDQLNQLVEKSDINSFRAADSIGGNWGDDSKVEIPEVGVSIGELSSSLRSLLGHETRITGEVYRTGSGIALTLRAGNGSKVGFNGSESEIESLVAKAAEAIFRRTQPYRFLTSYFDRGTAEEYSLVKELAEEGAPADRLWAFSKWSEMLLNSGQPRASEQIADREIASAPGEPIGYSDRNVCRWAIGHLEGALADARVAVEIFARGTPAGLSRSAAKVMPPIMESIMAQSQGAYHDALSTDEFLSNASEFGAQSLYPIVEANDFALSHDPSSASAILSKHRGMTERSRIVISGFVAYGPVLPDFFILASREDWTKAALDLAETDRQVATYGTANDERHTLYWPWLAYAWARSGNLQGALELIAMTPHDCTLCLEMRGRIRDIAGDQKGAEYWFGLAMADAPSLPFALTDWGAMLMRKGDYQGAIEKFRDANRKSAHFADPLEMWAEALMLQNRSDLALAKFEEACKQAPNWGRLHMKWGEALFYSGRRAEARAQFRIASTLDLDAADKAELSRDSG
jgi:tetratricopeptide (TPR) repeat protein